MKEKEEKSDAQWQLLKQFSDEKISQMDLVIKYDLVIDLSVDIN